MVTIDMLNGIAWQRCWDQACTCNVGNGYVKAKEFLGSLPDALSVTAMLAVGLL